MYLTTLRRLEQYEGLSSFVFPEKYGRIAPNQELSSTKNYLNRLHTIAEELQIRITFQSE